MRYHEPRVPHPSAYSALGWDSTAAAIFENLISRHDPSGEIIQESEIFNPYGTAAVETLTCGPTKAITVPGPAFAIALPENVCVVQLEVPASRVDTVVPDATNVPAGVAAT